MCLHVDDLCLSGGQEFKKKVIESLKKDFAVGSEDTNDIMSKDLSALAESSKKKQFKESEISEASSRGSLVDYESHEITTTTMSTTVAELGALMRCFGTCLFLKGLGLTSVAK